LGTLNLIRDHFSEGSSVKARRGSRRENSPAPGLARQASFTVEKSQNEQSALIQMKNIVHGVTNSLVSCLNESHIADKMMPILYAVSLFSSSIPVIGEIFGDEENFALILRASASGTSPFGWKCVQHVLLSMGAESRAEWANKLLSDEFDSQSSSHIISLVSFISTRDEGWRNALVTKMDSLFRRLSEETANYSLDLVLSEIGGFSLHEDRIVAHSTVSQRPTFLPVVVDVNRNFPLIVTDAPEELYTMSASSYAPYVEVGYPVINPDDDSVVFT